MTSNLISLKLNSSLADYFVIDIQKDYYSLFDACNTLEFEVTIVQIQLIFANLNKLALTKQCLLIYHDVRGIFELDCFNLLSQPSSIPKFNKQLCSLHQSQEYTFKGIKCQDYLSILRSLQVLNLWHIVEFHQSSRIVC